MKGPLQPSRRPTAGISPTARSCGGATSSQRRGTAWRGTQHNAAAATRPRYIVPFLDLWALGAMRGHRALGARMAPGPWIVVGRYW
uniref:Uncharacterized protein n=1 Tax=Oryza barthii TaxID=65489 RepID=A0A0D3HLL1_9ORYZ